MIDSTRHSSRLRFSESANHRGTAPYSLESVIGSGSMGVVYKGHDRVLGRAVAIKTTRGEILAGQRSRDAYRARFHREARIFGSLSHPNIATLFDVGETDDGLPFLVKDPEDRYPSAGALVSNLVDLFPGSWLGNLIADAVPEPRPTNGNRGLGETLTLLPPAGKAQSREE